MHTSCLQASSVLTASAIENHLGRRSLWRIYGRPDFVALPGLQVRLQRLYWLRLLFRSFHHPGIQQ